MTLYEVTIKAGESINVFASTPFHALAVVGLATISPTNSFADLSPYVKDIALSDSGNTLAFSIKGSRVCSVMKDYLFEAGYGFGGQKLV